MAGSDLKISQLGSLTTLAPSDIVPIVDNGTTYSINLKNLFTQGLITGFQATGMAVIGNLCLNNSQTPASSSAAGRSGLFVFDNNYLYICYTNNLWKRISLSSF